MKRLAFALGACYLTSSADFAGAPAAKPAACPYHAGQALTATIQITVHDRDVQADSATHVVIDHYNAPDCTLRLDSIVSGRNWALQESTPFSIDGALTSTVVNRHAETNVDSNTMLLVTLTPITKTTTFNQDRFVSCLDQDVPVRLSSGELVPIKSIVVGDVVADPLTGARLRVAAVIWGTQADEQMYRLGFGDSAALFTAQHPVLTRRGLVAARKRAAAARPAPACGERHRYRRFRCARPARGDKGQSAPLSRINRREPRRDSPASACARPQAPLTVAFLGRRSPRLISS